MRTMTPAVVLERDNGRVRMETDDLEYDLMASRTDLGRYFQAARRTDLPYLVVTKQAVEGWKRREPKIFVRFTQWLAAQGKQLVEV
jgi:hypothetical protein